MNDFDGAYNKDGRVRRDPSADPRDDGLDRDARSSDKERREPTRESGSERPSQASPLVPEMLSFDDLQAAAPPPEPPRPSGPTIAEEVNPFESSSLDASRPYSPSEYRELPPHRGGVILIFGLIGAGSLVLNCCCPPIPFGMIGLATALPAIFMGRSDLQAMDAQRMDPSGRGTVIAGMVIGIISAVLHLLCLAAVPLLFFLALAG